MEDNTTLISISYSVSNDFPISTLHTTTVNNSYEQDDYGSGHSGSFNETDCSQYFHSYPDYENMSIENYDDYVVDEYMYPGFDFEKPFYRYAWEILVVFVFIVNLIVIFVLLRRSMRNSTNIILAAIAISDSLTGLVTLPAYIIAYRNFDPVTPYIPNEFESTLHNETSYDYPSYFDYSQDIPPECLQPVDNTTVPAIAGYVMSRSVCRGFMATKYFVSKSFHTMSIFLTLFLGVQRYISVAYPFKAQTLLNTRNIIILCVVILIVSPFIHIYHLFDEKASNSYMCEWSLEGEGCQTGCIYLWFTFFIRHFIPCVILIVVTVLFILELRKGEANLRRMESNKSQLTKRVDENRRITVIVLAILIVFLIPEVPYGVFLLVNAIEKMQQIKPTDFSHLERNRAMHMSYELLLVLSFHANFYIYTFFNRRFRKCLKKTFVIPVRRLLGDQRRFSLSRSSSAQQRTRQTDYSGSRSVLEMRNMSVTNGSDRSGTPENKKFMESFSADVTLTSHQESNEMDALNANV